MQQVSLKKTIKAPAPDWLLRSFFATDHAKLWPLKHIFWRFFKGYLTHCKQPWRSGWVSNIRFNQLCFFVRSPTCLVSAVATFVRLG
jgi:hypothetical protein